MYLTVSSREKPDEIRRTVKATSGAVLNVQLPPWLLLFCVQRFFSM